MEGQQNMQDVLLDENQVAQFLGITTHKLQRDRWAGTGLPFVKIGRCVRYRRSDVEAYIKAHTVLPHHKAKISSVA